MQINFNTSLENVSCNQRSVADKSNDSMLCVLNNKNTFDDEEDHSA